MASGPSLPNAKAATSSDGPAYLQSLRAVRERCSEVHALGQAGKLDYFVLHEDKEKEVVEYCKRIIEVGQAGGSG